MLMKLVAKVFIVLNELLLVAAAVLLPLLAIIVAIKDPSALGMETMYQPGLSWELFILGLLLWELLVVVSFGVLAIVVENYKNLQAIAEHIASHDAHSNKPTPPVGKAPSARIEPSLGKSSAD